MQLTIDFSKLTTLDAIKAEILKFLKDNMVESGTVFYEIRYSRVRQGWQPGQAHALHHGPGTNTRRTRGHDRR